MPTVDINPKSSTGNSNCSVQGAEIFHEQNQRQCVNMHCSNVLNHKLLTITGQKMIKAMKVISAKTPTLPKTL